MSLDHITIYRGREKIISYESQEDLSNATIISQIREGQSSDTKLIVDWSVSFGTDGTDGVAVLHLEGGKTENVEAKIGYMDIIKEVDGELTQLTPSIMVVFKDPITAPS